MHPLARALHARVRDPRRVDDYYAPLAIACEAKLARSPRRPFVLGVQGPQGSGKTTLATALVAAFAETGVHAVTLSIDDFYLTRAEQLAVASLHAGNPCFAHRGYPGTHDLPLGRETLASLMRLGPGEEMRLPAYDKSAHHGRGDRAPRDRWPAVAGPIALVLIEGWMLGFSPLPDANLPEDLRAPNGYLLAYRDWPVKLDAFVHLTARELPSIVRWRVDAEHARRSRGEPALSDDDARDYIERFLPAYERYVPHLREAPPCKDVMEVILGDDRMPIAPLA